MRDAIDGLKGFLGVLWIVLVGGFFISGLVGDWVGDGYWTFIKYAAIGWGVLLAGSLIGLAVLIPMERGALLRRLTELMDQRDDFRGEELRLAAPETYLLMEGPRARAEDTFKLGLLQAIASGAVRPEKVTPPADLRTVPAVGSALALAGGGTAKTVKECVLEAKERFGDKASFRDHEVVPLLIGAGLMEPSGVTGPRLTAAGERAKRIAEGRVGMALHRMRETGGLAVHGDPRRVYFAAVLMASIAGLTMEEALTGAREAESVAVEDEVAAGAYATDDNFLFNWYLFNSFDETFGEMDAVAGGDGFSDGGGDGGDGGGDFGGGD